MTIRKLLKSSSTPFFVGYVALVCSPSLSSAQATHRTSRTEVAVVDSGGHIIRLMPGGTTRTLMPATAPPPTASILGPEAPRSPKAIDPVTVNAHKVCAGGACTIELTWAGASGPVTVVTATEPTFQRGVETLEMGTTIVHLTIDPFPGGDYFIDVADGNLASRAVQGMGYDPIPLPRIDSMTGGNWWWDPTDPSSGKITVNGAYLDPIAEANVVILPNRAIRASSVGPADANGFSHSATFKIPSDARADWTRLVSGGRSANLVNPGLLLLYPRGIPAYGSIRGVIWTPATGKIWVAADSVVDEIDLFLRQPVQKTKVTGLTKPYISRVSDTHELVLVDGVLGVTEVKVIDTTTGLVTSFATARDSDFTRPIRPVGIALDRDGTACYIADADAGRVVKIPRSNNDDITDEYGGYTSWAFPDPCGMEMAESGTLLIPDATAVRKVNPGGTSTEVVWNISRKTVLIDREASDANTDRVFLSGHLGFAECFNANPIEYGSGTATVPAQHLSALVYGRTNGLLSLENNWFYEIVQDTPQKVLLHNALQGDWPYPSPDQTVDRVVELVVEGWEGVPLHLELIDPPDLAPYIARDLDDPAGFTAFPYNAGDNVGEVAGEYGLTLNPDGSSPTMTLIVTPGADDLATFYLKVPPNVSGNNYQVKVMKAGQGTGAPIADRVVGLSPFYTTWKRIYVERDKMFRKGGLLARDYPDPSCSDCNRIEVFAWANVVADDQIALFDTANPFEATDVEKPWVSSVTDGPGTTSLYVYLKDGPGTGANPYVPSGAFDASADETTDPDNPALDFSGGSSAGIGVISGCDSASNQINDPGSCFFDADMRAGEQTFADPFVEVFAPGSNVSTIPYFPGGQKLDESRWGFSGQWFAHRGEPNTAQAIGAVGVAGSDGVFGITKREYQGIPLRTSYLFVQRIEDVIADNEPYCFQYRQVDEVTQDVTIHELLHQFRLNTLIPDTGEHCFSIPWTGGDGCMMHKLSNFHCPGIDPMRLDADDSSLTSANGGDLYDVRYETDPLP